MRLTPRVVFWMSAMRQPPPDEAHACCALELRNLKNKTARVTAAATVYSSLFGGCRRDICSVYPAGGWQPCQKAECVYACVRLKIKKGVNCPSFGFQGQSSWRRRWAARILTPLRHVLCPTKQGPAGAGVTEEYGASGSEGRASQG